jgi:hypothetical protein
MSRLNDITRHGVALAENWWEIPPFVASASDGRENKTRIPAQRIYFTSVQWRVQAHQLTELFSYCDYVHLDSEVG